jgi:heme-degrading monooxygenase HmoA
MILEIGLIKVKSADHLHFEEAVQRAVDEALTGAAGFVNFQLYKGVEEENTYAIHINWESIEDHMVTFRESPNFVKWREIISQYFSTAPIVNHWQILQ